MNKSIGNLHTHRSIQLDHPSIIYWEVIITFAAEVRFQTRDQFWIPQPNLHGTWYLIFCKTSKWAFHDFCQCYLPTVFSGFQGGLGTVLALWAQNWFFYLAGTIV